MFERAAGYIFTSRLWRQTLLDLLHELPTRTGDGHKIGLFRCSCGNETEIAISRVRNGYTKSCGCLSAEVSKRVNTKHGRRKTPEYASWQAMLRRCCSPSDKDYPRYGGRGVTVFEAWQNSFELFFAEVGPRPDGKTLDRRDTTKGYQPGNVRWATPQEQSENRKDSWSVEIAGTEYASAEEAGRAHGVSSTTIKRWCDGFFDSRRVHQQNAGFTPAKPGCRMWRKYAA